MGTVVLLGQQYQLRCSVPARAHFIRQMSRLLPQYLSVLLHFLSYQEGQLFIIDVAFLVFVLPKGITQALCVAATGPYNRLRQRSRYAEVANLDLEI